ncbi:MAG: L-threonylcarbamoyladenylate synthase, partial [Flavobacteriales bacterium]|nr:L-threonylcarbamoyladenylate synthase [Flavobacteriales bacterium]
SNYRAVEALCRLKKVKPEKANFSFICSDLSNLSLYARQIDNSLFKILKRTLPGPYTYILPAGAGLPKLFKGKKTVGIRVPDNNIPREIVRLLGHPIISTSVYDEDELLEYTTDPSLIAERVGNFVDIVIDGGYGKNVASTVVSLVNGYPEIIREGAGDINEII